MRSNAGMANRQGDVDLRLELWLGLAWLGLAWLGLAWLGLAWLGLAWLGLEKWKLMPSNTLRLLYKPTKENPAMEWRYYTTGGGIVEKVFEFVTKEKAIIIIIIIPRDAQFWQRTNT